MLKAGDVINGTFKVDLTLITFIFDSLIINSTILIITTRKLKSVGK